jgi:hypothetical protein
MNFSQPGVFYFNQPDTIYNKTTWTIDQEKLTLLKQHSMVIADFSSEHYGDDLLYILYDVLELHDINFLLLSHNPQDHLTRPRLLFYPHWYHWTRQVFANQRPNFLNNKKQYKISCLNGNPRPHRIYNFLSLRKKLYFNDFLFSMHQTQNIPTRSDDSIIDQSMLTEWSQLMPMLPDRNTALTNTPTKRADNYIQHPAYTDSYVNLVTETTVISKVFVTEKTWKPVASGQLFLIIGNPGTVDYLRSQGVDVFDDIIDHKYYDDETDWQARILKVHRLIEDLLEQDLYKINQDTVERRKRNSERFFAGNFDQQYQLKIQECIDTLK